MKKNMGTFDRVLRLVMATALFAFAYWQESWVAFAVAVFVLFEAVIGWCALYQILGKNSCPKD